MKKPLLLFLFILLFAYGVKAQSPKGNFIISTGIGYSSIQEAESYFYNLNLSSGEAPYVTYILPVAPELTMDFQNDHGVDLGVSACYQYINATRENYNDWYSDYRGERINRTNISLRILFVLYNIKNDTGSNHIFQASIGIKIGVSHWTDNPLNNFQLPNNTNAANYFMGPFNVPSFQLFVFFREYPFIKAKGSIKNLGLQEEFGYGTPYITEGGLMYKF